MQKQFRNVIAELQPWLDQVKNLASSMQADFMRSKKMGLDAQDQKLLLTPTDAVISSAAKLRDAVNMQAEGMMILRKAPPGIGSAVIDFLYNWVVDPRAETQKQMYMNQLNKLKDSLKDTLTIESATGMSSWAISQVARQAAEAVASFQKDQAKHTKIVDSLVGFGADATEKAMNGETAGLSEMIGWLQQGLQKNGTTNPQQLVEDFLKKLEEMLSQSTKRPDQKEKLQNAFEVVMNAFKATLRRSSSQFNYKTASLESLTELVEKYSKELEELLKKVSYFDRKVDEVQSQIKGEKESDLDTANRYVSFVKTMLGTEPRSVVTAISKVQQTLGGLRSTIEQKTLSQEKEQSQEQKQQDTSFEGSMKTDVDNPAEEVRGGMSGDFNLYRKTNLQKRKREIYAKLRLLKEKL